MEFIPYMGVLLPNPRFSIRRRNKLRKSDFLRELKLKCDWEIIFRIDRHCLIRLVDMLIGQPIVSTVVCHCP